MKILILTSLRKRAAQFGTELVAYDLAQAWLEMGHEVTLSGHTVTGEELDWAVCENLEVAPLSPTLALSRREHYTRKTGNMREFRALVRALRPDVATIVGFGATAINLAHLRVLVEETIPTTLWHHVPGITCQQSGLRYKNREPCDGFVHAARCAACRLTAAGVPELAADISAKLPRNWDFATVGGALGHLLEAHSLSSAFESGVKELADGVSHTFVGAQWVKQVLLINRFDPRRVSVVRPGLRTRLQGCLRTQTRKRRAAGKVRFVYWGRIDDTKGIDTAIKAVRMTDADCEFRIAGDLDPNRTFDRSLLRLRSGDRRIVFVGHLHEEELATFLDEADVAIIPSLWPETGPLTVFEARAAQLPILGANTGGIAEICAADPSARLFERNDAAGLSKLISELATDVSELAARQGLVPAARTMKDAAFEMVPVFNRLRAAH